MEFRKMVSVTGILVGSIVDFVGSIIWWFILGLILSISYSILYGAASSQTELTAKITEIFQTNPYILSINFLGGLLLAIFGGYIAAYIAKHDELLNSAIAGVLFVFLVILYGIFIVSFGMDTGSGMDAGVFCHCSFY
jgi:hypothetical protein